MQVALLMPALLQGAATAAGGQVEVLFELSASIAIRRFSVAGDFAGALAPEKRARLERSLEGVPLDAKILLEVAKRSFQEIEIAVPGFSPEDLVRAILAA